MPDHRRTRKNSPARKQRKVVTIDDPRGIRALAHPARMEAIDRLYFGDVLTATELAAYAELTPSAMSYHLRALAKWGVIERASGDDGRERRSKASGEDLQLGSGFSGGTPSGRTAGRAVMATFFQRAQRAVDTAMDESSTIRPAWRNKVNFAATDLVLSAAELALLNKQIQDLLEPHYPTSRGQGEDEDRQKVRYFGVLVPIP